MPRNLRPLPLIHRNLRTSSMIAAGLLTLGALAMAASTPFPTIAPSSLKIYPTKDGTLIDGGVFGPLDGQADYADWSFNGSSNEGSIALTTSSEHRVVWEYDLSGITYAEPVTASISFTLRLPAIFPFPNSLRVRVFSYQADLMESIEDFASEPATMLGSALLTPSWPPPPASVHQLAITDAVNAAIQSGASKVAVRFQIEPDTNFQVFIDAVDSDPTTKPFITIIDRLPGDTNDDNVVALDDWAGFSSCLSEPTTQYMPGCDIADLDFDLDVDLRDMASFQNYFQSSR